jgi:DNA-binding transcriptional LysR family regulator
MDRDLINTDLNLLKVLHALLEARNVTHAAERLFVSQSAISKSLTRLRKLFGDALFLRSPHGLIATPRAEELAIPVKEAIEALSALLKASSFDPYTARATVRIAAPEPFLIGKISALFLRLQEIAPNVTLEVLHLMDNFLPMLMTGALDFTIYLDQSYPDGFVARPILSASPRVWFRKSHPLNAKKSIDLSDTCKYPQVAFHSPNVTADDVRIVETAMVEEGLERKVVMSTSYLFMALEVLTQSDTLMLGPEYLSAVPAFSSGIASRSVSHIPAFRHLKINLSLIQHERTANSPLYQWLAGEIERSFASR